jgi:hypothetical protein
MDCILTAITGRFICCIIRTLNPTNCDAVCASFGAIAHTQGEIAAVSGKYLSDRITTFYNPHTKIITRNSLVFLVRH